MMRRFRMIAGPNGSGKSTLVERLSRDYAVNFYELLNADDIFAAVRRDGAYLPRFSFDAHELLSYVEASSYDESEKRLFRSGQITVESDCLRFAPEAVNSYSIALLTNFLQDLAIRSGASFSQETVFSHPSKVQALRRAKEEGYRTYLYYIATSTPSINARRVANRLSQGGHGVPEQKIIERYDRSLAQVKEAIPYLSRAYFFDNSGAEMVFLCSYAEDDGYSFSMTPERLPRWFRGLGLS